MAPVVTRALDRWAPLGRAIAALLTGAWWLVVSAYLSVGKAIEGHWPLGLVWRPVGWRR